MSRKVEPKRTYTATEIKELGLLPWARDTRVIARILSSGLIKAKVSGTLTHKRYLVKGKDLVEYIKKYGPVLMHTARKLTNKKHGKGSRSKKAGGKSEA